MVVIRLASEDDAAAIAAIYGPNVSDTVISFETVAPDRDEISRRVTETLRTHPWLVCEVAGEVAGYAYAGRHAARAAYRWSVDVSVYIDGKYRRSGIGRGLYTSLFAVLRQQGFFNAYAGITLPNEGSVGLHEAMGFRPVGVYAHVGHKFGRWHDVGWWELALKPLVLSPEEPMAVGALMARSEWRSLLASGENLIHARAV